MKEILAHFGRIDVTVNNAGYILVGAIEELSDAEIRANFDINVFGTMNVIRAVMPVYRAQNGGYFLNIASLSGSITAPGQAIYSASKAARALMTLAASANPPGRIYLGADSFAAMTRKNEETAAQMQEWHDLSLSTRYENP